MGSFGFLLRCGYLGCKCVVFSIYISCPFDPLTPKKTPSISPTKEFVLKTFISTLAQVRCRWFRYPYEWILFASLFHPLVFEWGDLEPGKAKKAYQVLLWILRSIYMENLLTSGAKKLLVSCWSFWLKFLSIYMYLSDCFSFRNSYIALPFHPQAKRL